MTCISCGEDSHGHDLCRRCEADGQELEREVQRATDEQWRRFADMLDRGYAPSDAAWFARYDYRA